MASRQAAEQDRPPPKTAGLPGGPVYLDYNATAPILPEAREAMAAALETFPGNPSSPHGFGQEAKEQLESARRGLAALLGFNRRELYFTSGGSECNATVLTALAWARPPVHLVTSPIEHPSVLRTCEWLAERGVGVSYLPVDGEGAVQAEALPTLLRPETRLVSVMAANNETGVIQPLALLGRLLRESPGGEAVRFHTDAVQAFGRIPLPLAEWGVDAATVAAHKIGGPRGIGALALREGFGLEPLIRGGSQERGLRAGTESVYLARGFHAAAAWVWERFEQNARRLATLRDGLIERLGGTEGFFLNGAGADRLPNTVNGGFEGVAAQTLVVAMDLAGVAVSTGAACQSGAIEPSHVLRAMGLPEERVRASVRISMGPGTTESDVERCAAVMLAEVARVRSAGGPGPARRAGGY